MKTKKAKSSKAMQAVRKVARAKADPKARELSTCEIGVVVQQGDVYLHRVADAHSRGKQIGTGLVQIALGTGNGARHMAEGSVTAFEGVALPPGMRAPMNVEAREVTGPVVVAADRWRLTHPEHPHFTLPAGTYQVTYQYDPRTMQRVQD